jgi:hypothetical protein
MASPIKRLSVEEKASPRLEMIVSLLRHSIADSGIIPGTPYLIHERAGGQCYCLLMAGLVRVVAPDRH